jgi:hypothetical protein
MRKFNLSEKYIIPFILGGVLIYLAYRLFKKSEREQKEESDVKDEIFKKRLEIKKAGLTSNEFSETELNDLASRLEQSMFDVGTDTIEIKNVFSKLGHGLHGELDFLMLKKAFGHRPYTGGVFPNLLATVGMSRGENLQYWLNEELNESQKTDVNDILEYKEISYRI